MRLDKGLWVIIADSQKFLVLENQGSAMSPDLRVLSHETRDNPSTRAQGRDKPGRMNTPATPRSAFDDTDWHALEKDSAAKELGQRINAWVSQKACTHFVLAADPRTLGAVRNELTPATRDAMRFDLNKDLTGHTIADITQHLQDTGD